MHLQLSAVISLCFISLCFLLSGCGDGVGLPVVTASGQITQGGQPLGGATLVFAPAEGEYVGSAISEADGSFDITLNNQSGALPGNYKVIVTKYAFVEAGPPAEHEEAAAAPPLGKLMTPEKYSRLDTTDLTISVPPDGSRALQIELP